MLLAKKKIYNMERLAGTHRTSLYDTFTHRIGVQNVNVQIPKHIVEFKKGYLQDRRPASNCDHCLVRAMLIQTILLHDRKQKK